MTDKPTLGADEQFCPSCGEVIKQAAEICPKCGVRLEDSPKESFFARRKWWIIGVCAVLVIGIIGGSSGESSPQDSSPEQADQNATSTQGQTAATATPTPIPAPSVSYGFLVAEREKNATRFDVNYKDQYVELDAVVIGIDDGNVKIAGPTGFLDDGVIQDLPTDVQIELDKGMHIKAVCKVGNFIMGSMYFDSCILPISIGN